MNKNIFQNKNRNSFTLIELLVVLALVAILSVVVVMTLNPAELLKQARDSNRLSDLATINTALNLFSTDVTSGFMGTSTVVYVSLPSTTSTCSNLGLPTLPTGYTYNCVTSQNLRNTDGTGWIPVSFQRISSNTPISQLPIDPTNTTSTRLYYTYTPGGSWELNATVEASKNKLGGSNDLVSKDGGSATSLYEIGTNLSLNPIETGDSSLVGYWNFEEGSGATVYDRSGNGQDVSFFGTQTGTNGYYSPGKAGSLAGTFDGSTNYASASSTNLLSLTTSDSLSAWVKRSEIVNKNLTIVGKSISGSSIANISYILQVEYSAGYPGLYLSSGSLGLVTTKTAAWNTNWHHITGTWNGSSVIVYVDGVAGNPSSQTVNAQINSSHPLLLGSIKADGTGGNFGGLINDVRIYNRALSAAEVLALYNGTK